MNPTLSNDQEAPAFDPEAHFRWNWRAYATKIDEEITPSTPESAGGHKGGQIVGRAKFSG
jgi:hypothetical protein